MFVELQRRIATEPVPVGVMTAFLDAGLTQEDVDRARESILALDTNQYVGSIVGLLASLGPGPIFCTFDGMTVAEGELDARRNTAKVEGSFRSPVKTLDTIVSDGVTLTLATANGIIFSDTVPPGALKVNRRGVAEFRPRNGGGIRSLMIRATRAGEFSFEMEFDHVRLSQVVRERDIEVLVSLASDGTNGSTTALFVKEGGKGRYEVRRLKR
jgi:hypothetical protein